MENRMHITTNDYQRLTGLTEFSSLKRKMPDIASRLDSIFKDARMLPQDRISDNVITMNSRVLLKDLGTNREVEITITYPQEAEARERKVSVFSTIGVALLGRRVGDVVSWKVPGGTGHFSISKIVYQPEAVGHYHL